MREKLEAALHEVDIYGIGATSNVNQKVILQAARAHAALVEALKEATHFIEATGSVDAIKRHRAALALEI